MVPQHSSDSNSQTSPGISPLKNTELNLKITVNKTRFIKYNLMKATAYYEGVYYHFLKNKKISGTLSLLNF